MRVAVPLGGTDWGRSGIGTYVREVLPRLSRRLDEGGDEMVALGTPRELNAYEGALDGARRARVPSWADRPAASALWHLLRVAPRARRERADVLLMPAANRRSSVHATLPTVAVVHDLAQLHVPDKYDTLRMAYLKRVLLPALRAVDAIVTVSEATRRDVISALGGASPPVRVVPNGVDWKRFARAAADDVAPRTARQRLGLPAPYILYPARLEHPGKNHLRLLRAFARSRARDTHVLALAGKDYGGERVIRSEIRQLRLDGRVRLLGFAADELLPGLMAGADAVVMVGLHEGFGLPALEALAAGRPVCAARTGALPEVVGELAATCDPMSESSILRALEATLYDAALRTRCAQQGPGWAEARSWERTVDGLLQACREVLRPSHAHDA